MSTSFPSIGGANAGTWTATVNKNSTPSAEVTITVEWLPVAGSFPPQTSDSALGVVVPEGFRPGVLATNLHGGFIAIDISMGESIQFTAKDLGVLGSTFAGTLLTDGVVVISDISEGNSSQASVYDNGSRYETQARARCVRRSDASK